MAENEAAMAKAGLGGRGRRALGVGSGGQREESLCRGSEAGKSLVSSED